MFEMRYYPRYPKSKENQLIKELIRKAKKGVDVEIILEISKNINIRNTRANKKVGRLLSRAGVKVYYDNPHRTTHCKLIIVDKRFVVIGSTNWTYHGLEKNNESSVLIDSKEIARYFLKYFEDIKKRSKPSSLSRFER
jgi:cardiolipin synthase